MGGQLYLNNGQPPNRANVCVSGYERGKENFALSNFDDNNGKGYWFKDPKLGKVWFPTSEHYLHFQKIKPEHKAQHLAAWQNEKSPGVILAGIRDPKSPYHISNAQNAYMTPQGFNNKAWDSDKVFVQMQINAAKYQQSQDFRDCIQKSIDLGKAFGDNKGPAAIIEDTSSLRTGKGPEEIWGTGPAGKGTNILGNSQTAFAMMVQNNQFSLTSPEPELQSFKTANVASHYANARTQYQHGIQGTFADVRKQSKRDQGLGQPDTSDLGSHLVQRISAGAIKKGTLDVKSYAAPQAAQQANHNQMHSMQPRSVPHMASSSQSSASREVSSAIQQMIGQSKSEIPLVSKGALQGTFKMAFDNAQDAKAFKQLLEKSGLKGISYYGDGEKYPMKQGGKELGHIVRFENNGDKTQIPPEALKFLHSKFDDENKVADVVEQMGFERPEPANRYTI